MTGNPYSDKMLIDVLLELAKDHPNPDLVPKIAELRRIVERDTRAMAKTLGKELPAWEDWA